MANVDSRMTNHGNRFAQSVLVSGFQNPAISNTLPTKPRSRHPVSRSRNAVWLYIIGFTLSALSFAFPYTATRISATRPRTSNL